MASCGCNERSKNYEHINILHIALYCCICSHSISQPHTTTYKEIDEPWWTWNSFLLGRNGKVSRIELYYTCIKYNPIQLVLWYAWVHRFKQKCCRVSAFQAMETAAHFPSLPWRGYGRLLFVEPREGPWQAAASCSPPWSCEVWPQNTPKETERPRIPFYFTLGVKLPTIWTDETPRWEETAKKREDQRRGRTRRKKMQLQEKVEKSRNIVFSTDLWTWRVNRYG